jgi:hypothetical protein
MKVFITLVEKKKALRKREGKIDSGFLKGCVLWAADKPETEPSTS